MLKILLLLAAVAVPSLASWEKNKANQMEPVALEDQNPLPQQPDKRMPQNLTVEDKLERLNTICPDLEEFCLQEPECASTLFQLLNNSVVSQESSGYQRVQYLIDHCVNEVRDTEAEEDKGNNEATLTRALAKQKKDELATAMAKKGSSGSSPTPPPTPAPVPPVNTNANPDAFTLIFISDMEVEYRHHTTRNARKMIETIVNLKNQEYYFSDGMKVDPKIVLHGGDNTDWLFGSLDDAGFEDVWQQLYDAGIPMVSGMGNHDYSYGASTDYSGIRGVFQDPDRWNKDISPGFAAKSVSRSTNLGVKVLASQAPKDGYDYGPTFYNLDFMGLQIVQFSLGPYSPSYRTSNAESDTGEEQYNEFIAKVNTSRPTIITAHYPYTTFSHSIPSDQQSAYRRSFSDFLQQFPEGSAYLNGHSHVEHRTTVSGTNGRVLAYTAPYPWPWAGAQGNGGYFAVQVSPTKGVIEVQTIATEYDCKSKGSLCGIGTTCDDCCLELEDGEITLFEYWYSKALTACGKEPCWRDGRICGIGTTCNACCNGYEYWDSLVFTACGNEPCWDRNSHCGAGTTCDNCCNGYHWSWEYFFTVCR